MMPNGGSGGRNPLQRLRVPIIVILLLAGGYGLTIGLSSLLTGNGHDTGVDIPPFLMAKVYAPKNEHLPETCISEENGQTKFKGNFYIKMACDNVPEQPETSGTNNHEVVLVVAAYDDNQPMNLNSVEIKINGMLQSTSPVIVTAGDYKYSNPPDEACYALIEITANFSEGKTLNGEYDFVLYARDHNNRIHKEGFFKSSIHTIAEVLEKGRCSIFRGSSTGLSYYKCINNSPAHIGNHVEVVSLSECNN